MLFSSMTFISLFLPIVIFSYFLAPKTWKNFILLFASIIFYAWGEPKYVIIMLMTIIINYFGALAISNSQHKKTILSLTIFINLSVLIYFKYFNFILDNINHAFQTDIAFINVIMPIGISFYTFQAMSYLVDVYREDVKVQKNIYNLALYITLFPQLVAGPIVRYHDIDEQLTKREENPSLVLLGIKRFIIGLSKKMLIANTMGAVVDQIFALSPDKIDVYTAWCGALCYSLQLFFDFSGYSDMAIGLGMIFGFRFLENFNYPYISKTIGEFWRRWHISLSTWFKEYLYIPLGGNRKGKIRTYINLFIVFLTTGIWHGASWNFVVWGLWHGFFIILEKMFNISYSSTQKTVNFFKHIYVMFVFVIGWVIFRAENLTYALQYLKRMFGMLDGQPAENLFYYIDNMEILMFTIGVLCSMPLFSNILQFNNKNKYTLWGINLYLIALFLASIAKIVSSTYNPFIYFRF